MRVLEGHVKVREDLSFGHQRNHFVHRGVRVHVVQTHPCAQITQSAAEIQEIRLHGAPACKPRAVADVKTIRRRILADDEEFLDAALHEIFSFAHHVADRTAHQVTPKLRNDAERALMRAPFTDFQVRIVRRRQFQPRLRHQIRKGFVWPRQVLMHEL